MATITVLNTNDSGTGSLRQAISDASAGDTIVFDDSLAGSTIYLESELVIDKALTITGPTTAQGGPGLTLDGGTSNSRSGCRCVHATASVTLNNLVIANGLIAPDLTNADDTYETNEYGAGFYADYLLSPGNIATLNNCEITHCNIIGLTPYVYANAYGLNVAVVGGTLNMNDCIVSGYHTESEITANGYFLTGGFRGVVYGANASVNMTRVVNTCYYDYTNGPQFLPIIVFPLYGFVFDACNISLSSVNNTNRGLYISSGSLTLSNTNVGLVFSTFGIWWNFEETPYYTEPSGLSSLTLSGYNYLGVLYCAPSEGSGGLGAVTGSGYLAGWNLNADDGATHEPSAIFGNNTSIEFIWTGTNAHAQYLNGDTSGLKWLPNGQTLLEKQTGVNSWQKLTISDYTAWEDLDNPGVVELGLSEYTPFGGGPFIPDPEWELIQDPKDSSKDIQNPEAPYVFNIDYPFGAEWGLIYNPGYGYDPEYGNYAAYAIETEHTTTYRVWDGANFLTYTVEVEEPEPEPEPEPPEPVAVRPGRRVSAQLQMIYENESESAIPAGTPVLVGAAFGVAEVAIPAGATGVISILGTWIFPCANTTVASMGDVACWDDTNKVITTAPSGSSAGLTTEYNAIMISSGTITFTVADSTGWAVGDLFHIDDDEWTLEVTATTATTIKGQYVVQPQGYLEPDTGTLVQEVETPDVLPVGAFVNAVTSGETTATVMIFPAAPVNGESSSSEESGGGD